MSTTDTVNATADDTAIEDAILNAVEEPKVKGEWELRTERCYPLIREATLRRDGKLMQSVRIWDSTDLTEDEREAEFDNRVSVLCVEGTNVGIAEAQRVLSSEIVTDPKDYQYVLAAMVQCSKWEVESIIRKADKNRLH